MTSSFHDWAEERDDTLIRALHQAARNARREMREWAQAELNADLVEAELQEGRISGLIGASITDAVKRLRHINQIDLPDAVRAYDDVIDEVFRGGFTDVYEAYDQLQNGCAGLVRIVRELLKIRLFIGEQEDS